MGKSLLVVESPTKMRTLSKFVGDDFIIRATNGHIKDLPKSKLGVNVDEDFTPDFVVIKGKEKTVDDLRKSASRVKKIFIGSDPDREGEAIAFHVAEEIGAKKEIKRVLFHEITKKGVLDAIESPTDLDMAKYEAQKARRILDRLVGYQISPLLWEKVKYGLSAGRVQSVALRLVCDREEEIDKFEKEEYWTIDANLALPSGQLIRGTLEKKGKVKLRIPNNQSAEAIKQELSSLPFTVVTIETKEKQVQPQPAFITSRLQQEASRKLKFSPKKTMMVAQKLYEGVEIGDEGLTGLITYMRTDSVRVSDEAIESARHYVEEHFGKSYLPRTPNHFKNKKSAQDAHEAIRPAYVDLTPEKLKPYLEKDLYLLYDLIWKRFLASQMVRQRIETKSADIEAGDYTFIAKGKRILFDGFTRIYEEGSDEDDMLEILPDVREGDILSLVETILNQRFTMPPPRFNEASLIRTLENKGIGRPSTYATIVSTIQDRSYAKKDGGRLVPTSLGVTVNGLMKDSFPLIVDIDFTAKMEERLDLIEDGKKSWVKSLVAFNNAFGEELKNAKVLMKDLKREEKETDIVCEKCGKKMLMRWSRNGEYIFCSGKPACTNKKNVKIDSKGQITVVEEEARGLCPQCGGTLVERNGRFGRFLACNNYPACKHTEAFSIGFPCPEEGCTGKLVERTSKKKKRFISCSRYPECTFSTNTQPTGGPCEVCGAPTLFLYRRKTVCLRKGCGWKSK